MSKLILPCTRRAFVGSLALGAAAFWTPGVFAEDSGTGKDGPDH